MVADVYNLTAEYIKIEDLDALIQALTKRKCELMSEKIEAANEELASKAAETSPTSQDDIHTPTHYVTHAYEAIDEMIATFGVEAVKSFCKCNAWKYRYRAGSKNSENAKKDNAKADEYMRILRWLNCYGYVIPDHNLIWAKDKETFERPQKLNFSERINA